MGKKLKGAALRAKKRAQEATDQLQEAQAEVAATQMVRHAPDQALFVLDTDGDAKQQTNKSTNKSSKDKVAKTRSLSAKDLQQVQKLLDKHKGSPQRLQQLAQQGAAKITVTNNTTRFRRKRLQATTSKTKVDLWDEEDTATTEKPKTDVTKTSTISPGLVGSALAGTAPSHVKVKVHTTRAAIVAKKKIKAIAVDVAHNGQSYLPDAKAHNKVLQQAVDVELRRKAALKERQAPIAQGMSEETKALLLGDSDSEEDSDNDNDNQDVTPVGALPKRADKLTKAQRNKQRRLKLLKGQEVQKQKETKLLKQVGELPVYRKQLKRQEKERKEKKELVQQLKAEQERVLGKDLPYQLSIQDPIHAPTVPVSLTKECQNTTLRSIKPKGSLIVDRMVSLVDRKMAVKRQVDNPDLKKRRKKRRLNLKGKKNLEGVGVDFAIKG